MIKVENRKKLNHEQNGDCYMTVDNLKICIANQQNSYQTLQLNTVVHLQYYGFANIANLQIFQNANTLYLNNNCIEKIEIKQQMSNIKTVNLANNRINNLQPLACWPSLKILDLSNNKLDSILKLDFLPQLQTLNLTGNKLYNAQSISGIVKLTKLYSLNLSKNELPAQNYQEIYKQLKQITSLGILYLTNNPLTRGIPNYRKKTIFELQNLNYLDDRPVTQNDKRLVKAWQKGGIEGQKQMRKIIAQEKAQQNHKLSEHMMKEAEKSNHLRQLLFDDITLNERKYYEQLLLKKQQQKDNLTITIQQYDTLSLQIEQLKKYLELMREAVKYMSVGAKPSLMSLISNENDNEIIVYNVEEQDLPIIRQKFYPDTTKPIVIHNYKQEQQRWIKEYDKILQKNLLKSHDDINRLTALFNMQIYSFDASCHRKVKRFNQEQIQAKMKQNHMQFMKSEAKQKQHHANNQLQDLD